MPKRDLNRDMFDHKRERIGTAAANLEILSMSGLGRVDAVVVAAAKKYDLNPFMLIGVARERVTADGCATWASNNLNKLVKEELELARLSGAERSAIDGWLRELKSQCVGFRLGQPLSDKKRERLTLTVNAFVRWSYLT